MFHSPNLPNVGSIAVKRFCCPSSLEFGLKYPSFHPELSTSSVSIGQMRIYSSWRLSRLLHEDTFCQSVTLRHDWPAAKLQSLTNCNPAGKTHESRSKNFGASLSAFVSLVQGSFGIKRLLPGGAARLQDPREDLITDDRLARVHGLLDSMWLKWRQIQNVNL